MLKTCAKTFASVVVVLEKVAVETRASVTSEVKARVGVGVSFVRTGANLATVTVVGVARENLWRKQVTNVTTRGHIEKTRAIRK